MKVLIALLDEEASTPPCQNKADLLSEDQPVLSGPEGTSILTLFRLAQIITQYEQGLVFVGVLVLAMGPPVWSRLKDLHSVCTDIWYRHS